MVLALMLVWALDGAWPPSLARFQQTSPLILDRDGRMMRAFTAPPGVWRLAATAASVDPLYLRMLVAYEDQRFHTHPGVDLLAAGRAVRQWLQHGQVVSGASTLTMQAARLLQPHRRDLLGKLGEMARALQLERRYSKDEILSVYLTLAPFGGNLEGVRAASLAWFGKEPSRLTAGQAALLVVLPQAPSRLRPDRFPLLARAARNKVLERMRQLGVLSDRQAAEARQEALPTRLHHLPALAPHLARRLHHQRPRVTLHPTFIDSRLQQTLETLARQQHSTLEASASVAILVVAHRQRQVLAYVGNSDFYEVRRAGQVDLIRAVRSPGSTLKPLIYGLGFDDVLIHPETLIDDAPTQFGDYRPSNFRHTYAGQVMVREALQQSLNIPAVAVLEQVGPARLAARLRTVGLPLHWSETHRQPGLPLALGGVGMTLEQLVTLYAGLANGGLIAPLRFSPDDALLPGQRLLTATACWYLHQILSAVPAPSGAVSAANHSSPRLIAHKTGTSYGFRDAWALGFDAEYTVGVWVGRADGSPSPGFYGRNTAAPVLFRVFNLLPAPTTGPTVPPADVLQVNRGQLPERLRYFRSRLAAARGSAPPAPPLILSFPVHGSTLELTVQAGQLADLPLMAQGGMRPLRWLVNGQPLAVDPWRREAFWPPDGAGLARITVLDQAGQSASAEVWLRRAATP